MNKEKSVSVLIVDDEERFRATTATILQNRGFEVKAVGSGREAIEEVSRDDFDVVVLDVKMPGIDGNEALREIKRLKPATEVIMLTAFGTPESAAHGLDHGVFEYLAKPCAIDELARKIRDAVARKNALPQAERKVRDVMLPITSFSTIREDRTVAEAIEVILQSFVLTMTASAVQETVHRSILVMDNDNKVSGVITFTDLLQNLHIPSGSEGRERSGNHSGMFTILVRDLARKRVKEIMSTAPPVIAAEASLMEAVSQILNLNVRRLLVMQGGEIVGVVREQDVFFEMANIVRQLSV
jgi:DNA-binding response OmpR family regulator